ncbi:MAG: 4'-phosphopantetheinyl transferase superfamily protein [Spirochaetaceae bacterium]|jgi:phosphopantetheinyl transferase|nr:4'-phosphopantetheinyl transferase superfamily protein [Spirochaetaceae bacterium]
MGLWYLGLSVLSNPRAFSARDRHAEGRKLVRRLDSGKAGSGKIGLSARGRPYFLDGHGDFSISHSRRLVGAAYFRGKVSSPAERGKIGFDVEYIHPKKSRQALADRFFAPEEGEYISAGASEEEKLLRFYRLWVLKESFLKLQGLSVLDLPGLPSFSEAGNLKNKIAGIHFGCFEIRLSSKERYLAAYSLALED